MSRPIDAQISSSVALSSYIRQAYQFSCFQSQRELRVHSMLFYTTTREDEALILTGRSWSFKQKVRANHSLSQRCGRPSRTLSLLAHIRNQRLAISLRCAARRLFPTEPQDAAMLSYIVGGTKQLTGNSRDRQTKGTSCAMTSMSFGRRSTSTRRDTT